MKIRIHVTKEILRESMYCPSGSHVTIKNCAIANAIHCIFPDAAVDYWYIHLDGYTWNDESDNKIRIPTEATQFIMQFDNLCTKPEARLDMPEMSFDIDVPDAVIERIGIDEAKDIISKSKTLELVYNNG